MRSFNESSQKVQNDKRLLNGRDIAQSADREGNSGREGQTAWPAFSATHVKRSFSDEFDRLMCPWQTARDRQAVLNDVSEVCNGRVMCSKSSKHTQKFTLI
jgi:hypothetical protein